MAEFRIKFTVSVNSKILGRLRKDAAKRGTTLEIVASEYLECIAAWLGKHEGNEGLEVADVVDQERTEMTTICDSGVSHLIEALSVKRKEWR